VLSGLVPMINRRRMSMDGVWTVHIERHTRCAVCSSH
jgi:hypothetical protein